MIKITERNDWENALHEIGQFDIYHTYDFQITHSKIKNLRKNKYI